MFDKSNRLTYKSYDLSRYQSELRNDCLPRWLQEGRTSKDLVELCLDHMYRRSPAELGISLQILDGDPKSLVIASILRKNVKTPAQAELIYDRLKQGIDWSRELVFQVSQLTGSHPVDSNGRTAFNPAIARAGVARSYTPRNQARIEIINRPVTITVCTLLLLFSAILTLILLFKGIPGLDSLRTTIGIPGMIASVIYTTACAFGYWTMRKWGVLLYALEPLLRWYMDLPGHLIAFPLFIVAAGIIHFDEMTWK